MLGGILGGFASGAVLKIVGNSDFVGVLRGTVAPSEMVLKGASFLKTLLDNPQTRPVARGLALEYASKHGYSEQQIAEMLPLVTSLLGIEIDPQDSDPLLTCVDEIACNIAQHECDPRVPCVQCPHCYKFILE